MNQPSVVPSNECIFCSHNSKDLEGNVIHMTERHSFFLPDAEYLTDLEGMMTYLGEKVGRQGCQKAKFNPFLSLDCARVEGVGAQSKERKGSNFAVQRSGAIFQKPGGPNT